MREEIIEKLSALITAAFGFVAALAWNSAIQSLFAKYYQAGEGIWSKIIYAIIVTIIAVLLTIWIGKSLKKAKEREELLRKQAEKIGERINVIRRGKTRK